MMLMWTHREQPKVKGIFVDLCVRGKQKSQEGCASKFCTVRRETAKVHHQEFESQIREVGNER
jgi:hypothetical protein